MDNEKAQALIDQIVDNAKKYAENNGYMPAAYALGALKFYACAFLRQLSEDNAVYLRALKIANEDIYGKDEDA